jgi:hypothetical protein
LPRDGGRRVDNVDTIPVTVVVLPVVALTPIENRSFAPRVIDDAAAEEVEAAQKTDAGPLPRPRRMEPA